MFHLFEIASIWWNNSTVINVVDCTWGDKITVIMEYGQMNGSPWFAVWKNPYSETYKEWEER